MGLGLSSGKWIDKLTDESNWWLDAVKMEDEGNYDQAWVSYVKDALECLENDLKIKAALSFLCAANCLFRLGNFQSARELCRVSATIYENFANFVISKSIRESLWSLQEAYDCYLLASNYQEADKIHEKFVSLKRKINPFFGEEEAMDILRSRKESVQIKLSELVPISDTNSSIGKIVNDLLQVTKGQTEQNLLLQNKTWRKASEDITG